MFYLWKSNKLNILFQFKLILEILILPKIFQNYISSFLSEKKKKKKTILVEEITKIEDQLIFKSTLFWDHEKI